MDASNYRQPPIGVVIPRDADDVIATVAAARRFGAPVLSRGGGTSLAGQCCNVAVVLDYTKYMNAILELDPQKKIARVQPGIVLDTLRDEAEKHHLTFGPDPATHSRCTLGGMIGNNSCGVHALMAGKTADNVEALDILLYDGTHMRVGQTSDEELERIIRQGGRKGEIYGKLKALRDKYANEIRKRFPDIPRRVSGFNLEELLPENGFHVARALVGSEGTCMTVLEATLRLVDSPPGRTLLVLGYPDVYSAADHVPQILEAKPIGLEGIDHYLVDDMKKKGIHPDNLHLLPAGRGWLLVELGGADRAESDEKARRLMEALKGAPNPPAMKMYDNRHDEEMVWKVRESGLAATARVPGEPDAWPGWEDSAVPPEQLGKYLRELRGLLEKHGYKCSFYGHFGQGCLHTRIDFDLVTAEGIQAFRSFMGEAADLVLRYGGSLSGEHGDGQARAELLPKMFGDDLVRAFEEFKAIWDPDWKMNPGKVVLPNRMDEDLRLGTDYHPTEPATHFQFPADGGSLSNALLRCVGVGLCRRHGGGVMCPSYMVTREEMHATRGRARLLEEMLRGEPLKGGWKSEAVKEALDLCLACKGCKGDCPMQVDMATYKAEFLSHYYQGRARPRGAYAFGMIPVWARLASRAPLLVNFLTQTPGLREVAKAAAGIAPARRIPAFAPETFKEWWSRRQPGGVQAFRCSGVQDSDSGNPEIENRKSKIENRRVVLWADTFNNHFHPTTAQAAVEVLEAVGFQVAVPMRNLCCGRPLYDYGMLDMAKRWLREILEELRPEIRAGTPMVVLEPSCCSVFRDELVNLLPHDEDAQRLSRQTYLLSELLRKEVPDFPLPKLKRKAVLHGHCHNKSLMKLTDEVAVLQRLGVEFEAPEAGCCGMAGAFGFEQGEHYDVSMRCGERALLPRVREAPGDALIIADGFSCREQIAQCTDRAALHLAQVIQMALREGEQGTPGERPERAYLRDRDAYVRAAMRTANAVGAAVLLVGCGVAAWKRQRRKTE